jgi:pimeloyl-ACP methyl ester carboxylesterase
VVTESELELGDGRVLHVYDTALGDADTRLTVFWHHGTPQTGAPPEPMLAAGERYGLRWVGMDRPGYLPSTPNPGRDVAAVAADAAAAADARGIGRFAVMGASGGGPHALACAALLGNRVLAVACLASIAPSDAGGLDWFGGMAAAGAAELRAAAQGRAALEAYLASADFDPELFTEADHAALATDWSWLGVSAGQAMSNGLGGMVDDDLAFTRPWGFDPATIAAPILFVHGDEDRVVPFPHGEWLARHCPTGELLRSPGDGHISVHRRHAEALDWLAEHAEHAEHAEQA